MTAPAPRRLAWDEPAPADLYDHLTAPEDTMHTSTTPLEIRVAALDTHTLASELARHAAVTARHLSNAELWQGRGNQRTADAWADSADRHEDTFLAELAEVERRLAGGDSELVSFLKLYGALALTSQGE